MNKNWSVGFKCLKWNLSTQIFDSKMVNLEIFLRTNNFHFIKNIFILTLSPSDQVHSMWSILNSNSGSSSTCVRYKSNFSSCLQPYLIIKAPRKAFYCTQLLDWAIKVSYQSNPLSMAFAFKEYMVIFCH